MNKKFIKNIKIILMILIVIAVGVVFYVYFSSSNTTNPSTESGKLLMMNVEEEYPSTSRDVVKLYNRMIKVLYENKWKDEDLQKMTTQMKLLFDKELSDNNPDLQYFEQTKADIAIYKKQKKSIVGSIADKESDVIYYKTDDIEYSSLNICYTMKEKKSYKRVYNQFLLRKDSVGKWRILGWKIIDEVQVNGD